jgi:serine/threonine protein kinase
MALKVLRTEFDEESDEARRVRDEGVLLAALDHPVIVGLHERFQVGEREVLAMEWVEGPALAQVVRKLGRIEVPVALAIARRVAEAASYAWGHEYEGRPLNLVHRDLNLSNILISIRGEVKILDYGLAKAEFDGREAQTLVQLQGTAGYTPPEGLHHDPCVDVYALGVCLFYMLSGHMPVLSRRPLGHRASLDEHLQFLREELRRRGEPVESVEGLLRALCAYEPHQRPLMREVIAQIDALQPEPVDLVAWADTHVHPLHIARERIAPRDHPSWAQLAFLEGPEDLREPVITTEEVDPDERLRRFLRKRDWFRRSRELSVLLSRHPGWSPAPLLEVLPRRVVPWWNPFARREPAEPVRVALRFLAHRPCDEVHDRVSILVRHHDPSVRRLAEAIVQGRDITAEESQPPRE